MSSFRLDGKSCIIHPSALRHSCADSRTLQYRHAAHGVGRVTGSWCGFPAPTNTRVLGLVGCHEFTDRSEQRALACFAAARCLAPLARAAGAIETSASGSGAPRTRRSGAPTRTLQERRDAARCGATHPMRAGACLRAHALDERRGRVEAAGQRLADRPRAEPRLRLEGDARVVRAAVRAPHDGAFGRRVSERVRRQALGRGGRNTRSSPPTAWLPRRHRARAWGWGRAEVAHRKELALE